MLITLFIILAMTLLVMVFIKITLNAYSDFVSSTAYTVSTITVSIITFISGYAIDKETNPTAIDVYRGKTTLEITYKDGVPIDTIVVFKERK